MYLQAHLRKHSNLKLPLQQVPGTEPTSGLVAGAGYSAEDLAGGTISGTYLNIYQGLPGTTGVLLASGAATSPDLNFQTQSGGNVDRYIDSTSGGSLNFLNNSYAVVDTLDSDGQLIVNAPSGYTGTLVNLEINGTQEFSINAYGHIVSRGTLPGIAAGSCAGTSLPFTDYISTNGTDTAGMINFYTGNGPCTGSPIVTVTFANAYVEAPFVALTPIAQNNNCGWYVTTTASSFSITCTTTPPSQDGWYYEYLVID